MTTEEHQLPTDHKSGKTSSKLPRIFGCSYETTLSLTDTRQPYPKRISIACEFHNLHFRLQCWSIQNDMTSKATQTSDLVRSKTGLFLVLCTFPPKIRKPRNLEAPDKILHSHESFKERSLLNHSSLRTKWTLRSRKNDQMSLSELKCCYSASSSRPYCSNLASSSTTSRTNA